MQHHQGSEVVLSTTLLNGIRLVDGEAFKQPAEFPFRKVTNFGCVARPLKPEVIIHTFLKSLVQEEETILFLSDYSDKKSYPQTFVIRTFGIIDNHFGVITCQTVRIKFYLRPQSLASSFSSSGHSCFAEAGITTPPTSTTSFFCAREGKA